MLKKVIVIIGKYNSIILRIKDAKFSGYCFHINVNM